MDKGRGMEQGSVVRSGGEGGREQAPATVEPCTIKNSGIERYPFIDNLMLCSLKSRWSG